jgi:FkbM family methyltransferase
MSSPVKSVRIGSQLFEIAGISSTDPYFDSIGGGFEPEFDHICNDFVRDDYVCVDLGANIGMKSLLLPQYLPDGCVVAIEAAPKIAALLEQNIARSGRRNIKIVKTAIGDRDGSVRFKEASAYGHISSDGEEVPVRKLDSVVAELRLERLDFVKIDVEGYEFPILRSSTDLLNRHQSLVLFEFNSWCQIALHDMNPKEFAGWIFDHFMHVFMIRRNAGENYLERLPRDGMLHFLHTNLVYDNVVTDLLVTNYERRLMPANRIRADLLAMRAERDASLTDLGAVRAERDAALADLGATRAERDAALAYLGATRTERDAALVDVGAARAERDAALAELADMRQSSSWKLTVPLRALSSAIRRSGGSHLH